MMDNRCIICGEIIPEGLQVCLSCMNKIMSSDYLEEESVKEASVKE